MVGTGLGAVNGILIRSGEALEIAHGIDTVVFDKTGTITEGKPEVSEVITLNDKEEKLELLKTACAIEKNSSHPLAQAFISAYKKSFGEAELKVSEIENIPGRGVKGIVEGRQVLVGNLALMNENSVNFSAFEKQSEKLLSEGKILVYVAVNNSAFGVVSITDRLKNDSVQAVQLLKKEGLKVILLSGDTKKAAEYIGLQIGADQVIAEVLPEDKAVVIEKLQKKGAKVMMVGDGINDAPALVQADVGAAIGTGSDVALESGDIVLMSGSLLAVPKAVRLSRMTIKNIKENLFWAFCYNIIGIPIAAGILYPFTGLLLTPMFGGLAMSLSSVCVVSNALRLRLKKLD